MKIAPVLTLVVALALGGCGGGSDSASPQHPAPEIAGIDQESDDKAAPRSDPDALTGFGATREAWDANHEKAPGYTDGAAYLPMVDTCDQETVAKYAVVTDNDDGVISNYSINLPCGTSLDAAKSIANDELRVDTLPGETFGKGIRRQGPFAKRCTFFVIDNARLEAILGALPVVIIFNYNRYDELAQFIAFTTYSSRASLKGKTC